MTNKEASEMRSPSFAGSSRNLDASRFVISTHLSRPAVDAKLLDARRNPRYTKLCLRGAMLVGEFQQQVTPLLLDRSLATSLVDLLQCDERKWERLELERTEGEIDLLVAVAMATGRIKAFWFSDINFNAASRHALATGLKYSRTVTELRLRRCMLVASIEVIGEGIRGNNSLQSVSVEQCGLVDSEVAHFVVCLRACGSLVKLSLEGNVCRHRCLREIDLLLQEGVLQNLSLHHQRVGNMERLGLAPLANGLRGRRSALKYLDLSRNGLGDNDIGLLLEGILDNNQCLETLHLDQNLLSNEGARVIAEALPHMSPAMKTIAIPENPFDERGALLLLDGIRENYYLELLIIPSGIAHIQRQIRWYGNLNKGGRRLFSTPRDVALSLYPLVLERVNNLPLSLAWNPETAASDTFYGFLRFGPILFEEEELATSQRRIK